MTGDINCQTVDQLPRRERVELTLSQLDQLPTLPAVAARLLAVTSSDETSARDVVEIVESDAALTTAILRLVQRADVGARGKTIPVSRAVTLLGFAAVRNAVLSMQVFEALAPSAVPTGRDAGPTTSGQPSADKNDRAAVMRKGLWQHSLAVACSAEMIGEFVGGRGNGGEAFVCGLLHDIGKIALDACWPKSYARVVDRVERQHACICDIERETFGLDHTVAGKRLVARWKLPQAVIECVWLHHQSPDALPSTVGFSDLVSIVHLADHLVRRDRIGYSGYQYISDVEELGAQLVSTLAGRGGRTLQSAVSGDRGRGKVRGLAPAAPMGLDAGWLESVSKRLPERMEPFRELLGLDDLSSRAEYTASLAPANRRLGQLNAKLVEINRRLEIRSASLAAMQHFSGMLAEVGRQPSTIGDVCVAAAKSIRTMLGVERALAFFGDTSGRCIHVGYVDGADDEECTTVIDISAVAGARLESRTGVTGLVPAPDGCDTIWQRCFKAPLRDALWMLPLWNVECPRSKVQGPRSNVNSEIDLLTFRPSNFPTLEKGNSLAIGGVLVAAPEEVIRRFRSAPAECEGLSTTMGLAICSARAQSESERLNEELVDLNRRLSAAQKELVRSRSVSMIAAMAAGAAHELNNPLSVISGRMQMELAKCTDEESARSLKIIIEQTQRATQIVTDLMRFAKPEPPDPVLQPLRGVLEPLCQHWRESSSLPDDQLTLFLADTKVMVNADAEQLGEILERVLANAVLATQEIASVPEGGRVPRVHINSPSRVSDETVRIVIEDNGVGMTRDVLEHAVDPFFSARPAGRGRGLGLSQAYRLAEVNGGRLWLESTPNVGTTVTIELPAR